MGMFMALFVVELYVPTNWLVCGAMGEIPRGRH